MSLPFLYVDAITNLNATQTNVHVSTRLVSDPLLLLPVNLSNNFIINRRWAQLYDVDRCVRAWRCLSYHTTAITIITWRRRRLELASDCAGSTKRARVSTWIPQERPTRRAIMAVAEWSRDLTTWSCRWRPQWWRPVTGIDGYRVGSRWTGRTVAAN